jgi:hypothetical protein
VKEQSQCRKNILQLQSYINHIHFSIIVQKVPRNKIALGPQETDNNNQMITLTKQTLWFTAC